MLSGRMMRAKIRVVVGDSVEVELTPYARIQERHCPHRVANLKMCTGTQWHRSKPPAFFASRKNCHQNSTKFSALSGGSLRTIYCRSRDFMHYLPSKTADLGAKLKENSSRVISEKLTIAHVPRQHGIRCVAGLCPDPPGGDPGLRG
jgi:hypothetical protein